MTERETGPIRELWNYFKRGKSELNFILNVYQTLIIIWGVEYITESNSLLLLVTVAFGLVLLLASILIGRYSLKKVDPTLPYLNPFSQDIIVYRCKLALGLACIATGDDLAGREYFLEGYDVIKRWVNES